MNTFENPPSAISDNPPAYGDVSSASEPSAPTIDQFKMYPDLAPPSYNDCVWGIVNVKQEGEDDHTHGDWEFMPRYPTYNTKYKLD